ncbi:MAG TPA: AbrB/MazE/SpoVT family DNA-binding domain-containing protein [Gammaproteobacteria bacterium]|nr:AbrB/MazE/SpoVT family DNA-binding domain-containing protein [Gammaproteobacteria bacterium]
MRITSKGQVTIPIEVRERLGLLPHSEVEFETADGDYAILRKADHTPRRGRGIVRRLRSTGTVQMSTDEIMALTRDS